MNIKEELRILRNVAIEEAKKKAEETKRTQAIQTEIFFGKASAAIMNAYNSNKLANQICANLYPFDENDKNDINRNVLTERGMLKTNIDLEYLGELCAQNGMEYEKVPEKTSRGRYYFTINWEPTMKKTDEDSKNPNVKTL